MFRRSPVFDPQKALSATTMETAYHTLVEYQEWGEPRRHLMAAIEVGVLSLGNIIAAMLGSERAWKSAVSICEQIMLVKLCLKLRIGTGSGLEPSRSSKPGNEPGIGLGWSFIMLSFRKYKQSSEDIPCRFRFLTIIAKSVPRRSMKPHNN